MSDPRMASREKIGELKSPAELLTSKYAIRPWARARSLFRSAAGCRSDWSKLGRERKAKARRITSEGEVLDEIGSREPLRKDAEEEACPPGA